MEEYIYIYPNNLEIALVYLPFNVGEELNINSILKNSPKTL